jgi:ATP-dependent Clp protease ATP-binding subunit ClpA
MAFSLQTLSAEPNFAGHEVCSVFERYSILSRQAVLVARKEAGQSGAPSICSEHLLIGIVTVHPELIKQLGIDMEPEQIRTCSERWHASSKPLPDSQDLSVSDELGAVFGRAASNADLYQCREIRTEHLLLSMLEEPSHAAEVLVDSGATKEKVLALMVEGDCTGPQVGTDASNAAIRSIFEAR